MTLSEARAELAGRGFDYLSAARMNFMLNNARNAFEDAWPFPWLPQKAVVGPPPLTITDLKYVRSVKHGDDELYALDFRIVAQDGTDIDATGVPVYWWLEGPNIIHTWPVDGSDITVYCTAESPELIADDQSPLIPTRYQPIWLDLAVVQAYKDSDNFTGAQALMADIGTRLMQVIERYETTNRQHAALIAYRSPSEDD